MGNEIGSIYKDFAKAKVRVVLVFPDAYEIGMSHMGLRILYDILNKREDVLVERAFAPLKDMEEMLREKNIPLFSLESKTPLKEFDVIGISLPYELTYTNILNILDLAGLKLKRADRQNTFPLVLGGGVQCYNPEPLADFFDAFALGDGEELVCDVVDYVNKAKENDWDKKSLLNELTNVKGVYVPELFEPEYDESGVIKKITSLKSGYDKVYKRIVSHLDTSPYPTNLVVPNARLVHDRIGVEIQRGCARGCRYCQAGFVERPVRQRSPQTVMNLACEAVAKTGMNEISLLSLSAGDYPQIVPLVKGLNKAFENQNVSLSVPATRTETLTTELVKEITTVRKTGFTIAPEAGSERMRRVINKGNLTSDLFKACENAFSHGYRTIKFYYMIGLPFETDDDLLGIAKETEEAFYIGKKYTKAVKINIGLSPLVPKPFTPFQWMSQLTKEETRRRLSLIRRNLTSRAIQLKAHDTNMNYLEGLFARGDRKLSVVIQKAFEMGCRFDQWQEYFDFSKWEKAIEETGVDVDFYLYRERSKDEILPWDHLFAQLNKDLLWQEFEKAKQEAFTPDCTLGECSACGVCDFDEIANRVYSDPGRWVAGSQGRSTLVSEGGSTLIENRIPNTKNRIKLRVRYAKMGWAVYYGNLELMSLIKRAILRAGFNVAYSEGFHPQMKLAMGLALANGVESHWEYFDLVLLEMVQPDDFISRINNNLPRGLSLISAEVVDLNATSIYSMTKEVAYEAVVKENLNLTKIETIQKNLTEMKQGHELFVTRKKHKEPGKEKKISINKYLNLEKTKINNKIFNFSLKCDDQGSLKPSEVIAVLAHVTREDIIGIVIKKIGVTLE